MSTEDPFSNSNLPPEEGELNDVDINKIADAGDSLLGKKEEVKPTQSETTDDAVIENNALEGENSLFFNDFKKLRESGESTDALIDRWSEAGGLGDRYAEKLFAEDFLRGMENPPEGMGLKPAKFTDEQKQRFIHRSVEEGMKSMKKLEEEKRKAQILEDLKKISEKKERPLDEFL